MQPSFLKRISPCLLAAILLSACGENNAAIEHRSNRMSDQNFDASSKAAASVLSVGGGGTIDPQVAADELARSCDEAIGRLIEGLEQKSLATAQQREYLLRLQQSYRQQYSDTGGAGAIPDDGVEATPEAESEREAKNARMALACLRRELAKQPG